VIERDFPANAQPVVISVPEPSSPSIEDTKEELVYPQPTSTDVSPEPVSGSTALIPRTQGRARQLMKAKPVTSITQISVSANGADIALSSKTDTGLIKTTKVLTLPASAATDSSITHTTVPPRSADDTYKISIDMQPRRHYPLIGTETTENSIQAAVIERHQGFVATTTSSTGARLSALNAKIPARPTQGDLVTAWQPYSNPVVNENGSSEPTVPELNNGGVGMSILKNLGVSAMLEWFTAGKDNSGHS